MDRPCHAIPTDNKTYSVAGIISGPLMSKYCSSKWALEAISDSARAELAHHAVSVSVVEPAYVKSEIFGCVCPLVGGLGRMFVESNHP